MLGYSIDLKPLLNSWVKENIEKLKKWNEDKPEKHQNR